MLHTTPPAQHALQPLRDTCHLSGRHQPGPGPQQPGLSPRGSPGKRSVHHNRGHGGGLSRRATRPAAAANQHSAAASIEPHQRSARPAAPAGSLPSVRPPASRRPAHQPVPRPGRVRRAGRRALARAPAPPHQPLNGFQPPPGLAPPLSRRTGSSRRPSCRHRRRPCAPASPPCRRRGRPRPR